MSTAAPPPPSSTNGVAIGAPCSSPQPKRSPEPVNATQLDADDHPLTQADAAPVSQPLKKARPGEFERIMRELSKMASAADTFFTTLDKSTLNNDLRQYVFLKAMESVLSLNEELNLCHFEGNVGGVYSTIHRTMEYFKDHELAPYIQEWDRKIHRDHVSDSSQEQKKEKDTVVPVADKKM